jgi:hydrogenase expression/formation protein HypE
LPQTDHGHILLAHGGGGTLMHRLIEEVFLRRLDSSSAPDQHDAAIIQANGTRFAFTTDSYVVQPLFFPGGDIGSLAVHGTVNDLAMSGARPLFLSAGFVLEEGFAIEKLNRLVQSMASAARDAGVRIVTGDTKVVDRGKGDGVYINTAGIGIVEHELDIVPKSVRPGDVIIVNGDIGRHGIAIMAQREGLEFETTIESDSSPVAARVQKLLNAGIEVHCMRDLTRGGLASALNEIASASGMRIDLDEQAIPVRDDVQSACEILGFDPLYVACEGRFVSFIPAQGAETALRILRADPGAGNVHVIGCVSATSKPMVTMKTRIGSTRIVDMLSGEQLPRIC